MGYVKNMFDVTAITGAFLNSDDTALTTNVFTTDPRLMGSASPRISDPSHFCLQTRAVEKSAALFIPRRRHRPDCACRGARAMWMME